MKYAALILLAACGAPSIDATEHETTPTAAQTQAARSATTRLSATALLGLTNDVYAAFPTSEAGTSQRPTFLFPTHRFGYDSLSITLSNWRLTARPAQRSGLFLDEGETHGFALAFASRNDSEPEARELFEALGPDRETFDGDLAVRATPEGIVSCMRAIVPATAPVTCYISGLVDLDVAKN